MTSVTEKTSNEPKKFILADYEKTNLFNYDAKRFLQVMVDLEKMNFKKVSFGRGKDSVSAEMTLYIDVSQTGYLQSLTLKKININYPALNDQYILVSSNAEIGEQPISFKVGEEEIIIGFYNKNQNYVVITRNIFMYTDVKGTLDLFLDVLKENFQKYSWKTEKVEPLKILCEIYNSQRIENLKKKSQIVVNNNLRISEACDTILQNVIANNLQEVEMLGMEVYLEKTKPTKEIKRTINQVKEVVEQKKDEIKSRLNSIASYLDFLSRSINENSSIRQELSERFDVNIFKKGVRELLELPFVKDLRIASGQIKFVIKDIKIKYGNREYSMGDFVVKIGVDGIKFEGSKYLLYGEQRYFHPHIIENRCCLGTFKPKMEELRLKFKFRELAILIKQFLGTYTPNDKYLDLCFFTGSYRDYKKFSNSEFNLDKDWSMGIKPKDVVLDDWEDEEENIEYNDTSRDPQTATPRIKSKEEIELKKAQTEDDDEEEEEE